MGRGPAAYARSALLSSFPTLRKQQAWGLSGCVVTLLVAALGCIKLSAVRSDALAARQSFIEKIAAIPEWCRYNYMYAHADPAQLESYIEVFPQAVRGTRAPVVVESLLDAQWMGHFPLPRLAPPWCGPSPSDGNGSLHTAPLHPPLFLMLHIFSAAYPSERSRRALIRHFSPMRSIPHDLQHLVEVRFVVGRSKDQEEEKALDREQAEFGDLVRLDDLQNGENMDQGKSQRWVRWVGRPGGKTAWWVL